MPRKKNTRNTFGVDTSDEGIRLRTYKGFVYASVAEMHYAMGLDDDLGKKKILSWSRCPSYPLVVNGVKIGRYTPDFLVEHLDGRQEIVEVKGRIARDFPLRLKVWENTWHRENPDYDYTLYMVPRGPKNRKKRAA